jgi:HK97 gp10 family phage protein
VTDFASIEMQGADELRQNFQALEEGLSARRAARELTGALVNALKVYADAARARAHQLNASVPLWRRRQWPTSPLHVAEAIKAQWARGDAGEVAATAGVPRTHFWGLFLEYGTRYARALPFLRPAWQPGEVLGKVADALRERLARIKLRRTS